MRKANIMKTAPVSLVAVLGVALTVLQGCQSVVPTVVGPSVKYYCELPIEARMLAKQGIDSRTLPNKVRIECYDEGQ